MEEDGLELPDDGASIGQVAVKERKGGEESSKRTFKGGPGTLSGRSTLICQDSPPAAYLWMSP